MNNAWNCYLLAFKNIFNYKDSANRQELNWFILFMSIFWILFGIVSFGAIVSLAISGKDANIPAFIGIIFAVGCTYLIVHAIPLFSLIRRRFNQIAPSKSKLFFTIWLTILFIQFVICNLSFFFIDGIVNPLLILPIVFLSQICGILLIGTVIFLMIREKPIV